MTPIHTQTAEKLLAQRNWLRNLARGLVKDETRADDLCQETLLQALHRPQAGASRPWLVRALRSLGARLGRDEQRRRRREAAAALRGSAPSAAQVVEQVATQQLVVDAVMKLDEPYRATILLRYWEDLPPREVARRMKVPVETVRTRLKRGLSLLRRRLDGEFGGRGSWVTTITAFGSLGRKSLLLASGAAIVKTKTIALAALVVAGIAISWPVWGGASATVPEPRDPQPAAAPIRHSEGAPAPAAERTAIRVATPAAPETREPAAALTSFRGRVLDGSAEPLALVGVRMRQVAGTEEEQESTARSDAAGYFSLVEPESPREIVVDEQGLATVLAGVVNPGRPDSEPVIVAAPALSFAGVVLGENGEHLSGALITCTLPEDFRARFGQVLDFSRWEPWVAQSDRDGGFLLGETGRIEGAELHVSMDGYLSVSMDQPPTSDEAMQIVLHRPVPVEGSLLGLVIDPSGVPVPEARVSLGNTTTVSDLEGRFIIDMEAAGKNHEVIAMKRGYLPGNYQLREWQGDYRAADQPFATVRLGGEPLSISGQLTDFQGQPLEGAKVWVADPVVFGDLQEGFGLISVEGYLSGGMTVGEMRIRFMGEQTKSVDQILAEIPTAKWSWVKTDASGRFTLDGLLDRPYNLSALLPDSLVRVDSEPFPAGTTNAHLVVPAGAVLPIVAGQVISSRGMPVAGVQILTICDTLSLNRVTYTADGRRRSHGSGRSENGRSTVTDQDGRFRLENIGGSALYLSLSGDEIMPRAFGRPNGLVATGLPVDDLSIRVSLRLHMRVELDDRDLADEVRALNAEGQTINLSIISGGGVDSYDRVPLFEGRSQVLSVPESVTALILYKNGEEVRRIPVLLEPGDVNVIRG